MSPSISEYMGFYEADEGAPLFRNIGEAIDYLCPEYREGIELGDENRLADIIKEAEDEAYNCGYTDAVNAKG